jgi:hypothetical protein|tara:strand:- start:417 stop:908 length:492 start_codon:yes stop_codon:yes gene_type:complete
MDKKTVPPINWIQGMSKSNKESLAMKRSNIQVKPWPSGLGTVELDAKKKVDTRIHYDVGQVDVAVNHSHMNKLRILKMTMENWAHDNGRNYALDSAQGRMYEADLEKILDLMEKGSGMIMEPDGSEFLGDPNFLTKDEMLYLNVLFKTYGGKRVTARTTKAIL